MKNFFLLRRIDFSLILSTAMLLSLVLILSTKANAQLTGIKLVDNTGAGQYLTVTQAITDLNLQGVGPGGVTIMLRDGQTFNEPPMTITATGTQSNPIYIHKSGKAANPTIYGIGGTISTSDNKLNGDAIFRIAGGDYIMISELNLYDSPSNTNSTTQMEYGVLMTRRDADTNACRNVSITDNTIVMNSSSRYSIGIFNSNLTASGNFINPIYLDADTNKRCENITFNYNHISDANFGIASIGIQDNTPPFLLCDQNVYVYSNTISGIGGEYNLQGFGVDVRWTANINIGFNDISGGNGTSGYLGAVVGIYTWAYDANSEINNNNISVYTHDAPQSQVVGISSGANGNTTIHNNEIKNCYSNGNGGIHGIYHFGSNTNRLLIYDNDIHNILAEGTSNYMFLIYANTLDMDSCNIYQNTIHDNNSNADGLASVSGIFGTNIHDNDIYNNSASAGMYGVQNTNTYYKGAVFNNKIHDNSDCTGIMGTGNIYGNRIYNLHTNLNISMYGIFVNGGTANIYNNFISNITAPNTNTDFYVAGIYSRNDGSVNIYYNSVYLNNNASTTTYGGSAAVYASDFSNNNTITLEMKNNILVNNSVPGSSGHVAAFAMSNAVLRGYSTGSDNNCLYTNTSLPRRYIYYNPQDNDLSIGSFRTRFAPANNNSISEIPPFINAGANDLHIRNDIANRFESGGVPVNDPVFISHDIDGDVRNATLPDIGADEFNGITIDKDAEIKDIGFSSVKYYTSNTVDNFTSRVKNNGAEQISFKVFRKVTPGSYFDSVSVTGMTSRTDSLVKFGNFTFSDNIQYTITDSIYLVGDQINSNNTASSLFSPARAKNYVMLWSETQSRDKFIAAVTADGRFNQFDMIDLNSFRGSLRSWKTVFVLYGDQDYGLKTWDPKTRDSLQSFLDNSTPSNKKTLLVFGSRLGSLNTGYNANNADSIFYHHYLKADCYDTFWGFDNEGSQYPFWQTGGRIKGLGNFSSVTDDTANVAYQYSNLLSPILGGEAALIPLSESGNGDSCVAVSYGGASTNYNTFYCSIAFREFNGGNGGADFSGPGVNSAQSTISNLFQTVANWVALPEIGGEGALPVELSSFTSTVNNNIVNLKWTTVSEINNSGFDVERKLSGSADWNKTGHVSGAGTTNNSTEYHFEDKNLTTGKYNYRLKQIDNNGNFKYYALSNEVVIGIPGKYSLSQNYPNPFNPSTKINFDLPVNSKISLKVFDMLGREIAVLLNDESREAGRYTITFDANKYLLASGIYFYQLTTKDFVDTKRFVLIK